MREPLAIHAGPQPYCPPPSPASLLPPCQDLKKYGATTVVRVCEVTYDKAPLEKDGITVVVRAACGGVGVAGLGGEAGTCGLAARRRPRRVCAQAASGALAPGSGCLPGAGWVHLAGPWGGSPEAVGRDPWGGFLGPRCWGLASRQQAPWDGPRGSCPVGRPPSQVTVTKLVRGAGAFGWTGLSPPR